MSAPDDSEEGTQGQGKTSGLIAPATEDPIRPSEGIELEVYHSPEAPSARVLLDEPACTSLPQITTEQVPQSARTDKTDVPIHPLSLKDAEFLWWPGHRSSAFGRYYRYLCNRPSSGGSRKSTASLFPCALPYLQACRPEQLCRCTELAWAVNAVNQLFACWSYHVPGCPDRQDKHEPRGGLDCADRHMAYAQRLLAKLIRDNNWKPQLLLNCEVNESESLLSEKIEDAA